jgi:F-type H+-transporting ATPase subunit b
MMLDAGTAVTTGTTTGTTAPAQAEGGFPPFDTTTFPSQLFWLALTFAFLFVVLWRVASPRIAGVITARRDQINGDVQAAERHRRDAEGASEAYETALAGARARAHKVAADKRKQMDDDVARARSTADADDHKKMAEAETRIAATRAEARVQVLTAAQDAAADIVSRLTGETVSAEDAAAAVRSATGSGA